MSSSSRRCLHDWKAGREGGRGIESISAGETQLDPQQSQAAALSEDTAGFVTWLDLGVSVKGNVLDYSDVRDIVSLGEIILMKNTCGYILIDFPSTP